MKRMVPVFVTLALVTLGAPAQAQAQTGDALQIYVIDVEGGNATLFVAPSGESLLFDTGNGGANAERDVGRMMAAIEDAGLDQLDHLVTSHWHGDHYGGMAELATRIPVRHYVDHGPTVEDRPASVEFVEGAYADLYGAARRTVVTPGDTLSLGEVALTIMASNGEVIETPLPGAGAENPHCASFERAPEDRGENARSVGFHFTLGEFRGLHLGDLTVNKEYELVCPTNPIGTVDLWIVSHHGLPTSNSRPLVHAIQPRVAIMNNGTRKGGNPESMSIIYSAPGLEDLWQLHFSVLGGQEYTVPGLFVANHYDEQPAEVPLSPVPPPPAGSSVGPPPAHNGAAHWIKVEAYRDGVFTVTNTRNGFSKGY